MVRYFKVREQSHREKLGDSKVRETEVALEDERHLGQRKKTTVLEDTCPGTSVTAPYSLNGEYHEYGMYQELGTSASPLVAHGIPPSVLLDRYY